MKLTVFAPAATLTAGDAAQALFFIAADALWRVEAAGAQGRRVFQGTAGELKADPRQRKLVEMGSALFWAARTARQGAPAQEQARREIVQGELPPLQIIFLYDQEKQGTFRLTIRAQKGVLRGRTRARE